MNEQYHVALKTRMKKDQNVYEFGPFRMVPSKLLLLRDGHTIKLPGQVYELLYVFARHPSFKILEREELERELFGNMPVDITRVSQLINKLRRRLVRRDDGQEYIETVQTEGYRLTVEIRVIKPAPQQDDLQVENLYRKGFFYLENYSEEGFRVAIKSFAQLIAKDPQNVPALLGLAEAYTWLTIFNYNELPAKEMLEKAKQSARRALELEPSSAAALAACGFNSMCYERNWDQALKELQEAIKLDPKLAAAHLGLGLWHIARDEAVAAVREIDQAHYINQLSPLINVARGFVLFFARRYEESLEQFRDTIKSTAIGLRVTSFDAAYYGVALVEAISGSLPKAHEAVQKAYDFSHNVLDQVAKAFIFALEKRRRKEALAELTKLTSDSKKRYISPYHLATIAAALGDNDRAFEWLYEARHKHDPWIIIVRMDPRFDSLHSDPRFNKLLLDLGLPPL